MPIIRPKPKSKKHSSKKKTILLHIIEEEDVIISKSENQEYNQNYKQISEVTRRSLKRNKKTNLSKMLLRQKVDKIYLDRKYKNKTGKGKPI